MNAPRALALSILVPFFAIDTTAAELPPIPPNAAQPVVPKAVAPFDLADASLDDSPFREAMLRNKAYLLSLEPDRFLHNFRLTAGLPSTAEPYGGWEAPDVELRGHAAGHYLSACSLMYRSTGDEVFRKRVREMVAGLAECQAASVTAGYNENYLSAFPESFIDRVENGEWVWAPWYTLHKIMAGLLDARRLTGNDQALDVLTNMTDWIAIRVGDISSEDMQKSLDMEFGGMNDVLAKLYALTGNPQHLRLAKAFDHAAVFDPLAAGRDELNGLHANTQIPKVIGAAEEFVQSGASRYGDIARFFWDRVANHRSFAFGGNSDKEHFFEIDNFSSHTGPETAETCNTYNMLKLTRQLFDLEPNADYMDFYERGLYNHILASQDPAQGMFIYMMPTDPGNFKIYSTPENSFWCCVGTGMENHAKYGESIYSHSTDQLLVNLYIPSTVRWNAQGVTLRQATTFPNSQKTTLSLECETPTEFALRIRHPQWIKGSLSASINGNPASLLDSAPGSYAEIRRTWETGDSVTVDLPMELHAEPLPGDADTVAIFYGPILLAGQLGTEGLRAPYVTDSQLQIRDPYPEAPAIVTADDQWLGRIQKVSDSPLLFQTKDLGFQRKMMLRPLYETHHQRMAIYWPLLSPDEWQARQQTVADTDSAIAAAREAAVDRVNVGEPNSEAAHAYTGSDTITGTVSGNAWRRGLKNGSFSYTLKTKGQRALELLCVIGARDENRVFDIFLDDTKLEMPEWEGKAPGLHRLIHLPIPAELLIDKDRATVRFQAEGSWNTTTANIFECLLVPAN